jgi:hypothetical protein
MIASFAIFMQAMADLALDCHKFKGDSEIGHEYIKNYFFEVAVSHKYRKYF